MTVSTSQFLPTEQIPSTHNRWVRMRLVLCSSTSTVSGVNVDDTTSRYGDLFFAYAGQDLHRAGDVNGDGLTDFQHALDQRVVLIPRFRFYCCRRKCGFRCYSTFRWKHIPALFGKS